MPIANYNAPRGFALVRSGGTRTPLRRKRVVGASRTNPIMIGDAYTVTAAGLAVKAVGAEGSPDVVHGIVEGIDLNPIASSNNGPVSQDYLPAADAGAIIGIEDDDADFVVECNADITNLIGISGYAQMTNAAGMGNLTLRQSQQALDTPDNTNTKEFRVMELLDSPADNALGANNRVVCRLQHAMS